MDAAAEIGRNPVSKHQIKPECGEWAGWCETGRLKPSREIKFSGTNGDWGNIRIPCSADHEQDWSPHPVDPCSVILCDYDHIWRLVSVYLPAMRPTLGNTFSSHDSIKSLPTFPPKRFDIFFSLLTGWMLRSFFLFVQIFLKQLTNKIIVCFKKQTCRCCCFCCCCCCCFYNNNINSIQRIDWLPTRKSTVYMVTKRRSGSTQTHTHTPFPHAAGTEQIVYYYFVYSE